MRYEWPVEKSIRAERAINTLAALRAMESERPVYEAAFIAARKSGSTHDEAKIQAESAVAKMTD